MQGHVNRFVFSEDVYSANEAKELMSDDIRLIKFAPCVYMAKRRDLPVDSCQRFETRILCGGPDRDGEK